MKEIKIQRLPATRSPAPQSRPRQTKDGAPIVERLEQLARELYEWSRRPDRTLPHCRRSAPRVSCASMPPPLICRITGGGFLRRHAGHVPARADALCGRSARCFESRCSEVMIRRKPVEETRLLEAGNRVCEKGVWLPGCRGPIDTDGWHADPHRPVYEYELSVATAYLFTSVANELEVPRRPLLCRARLAAGHPDTIIPWRSARRRLPAAGALATRAYDNNESRPVHCHFPLPVPFCGGFLFPASMICAEAPPCRPPAPNPASFIEWHEGCRALPTKTLYYSFGRYCNA